MGPDSYDLGARQVFEHFQFCNLVKEGEDEAEFNRRVLDLLRVDKGLKSRRPGFSFKPEAIYTTDRKPIEAQDLRHLGECVFESKDDPRQAMVTGQLSIKVEIEACVTTDGELIVRLDG